VNNKSDSIVVIESRGAHCVAANGYKDEDTWLDAIAAYAKQQRSDLDIQTQSDAVSYLAEKSNVSVQIITQAEYLDADAWDSEVVEAATALGWA
jgi:hypothetical protein